MTDQSQRIKKKFRLVLPLKTLMGMVFFAVIANLLVILLTNLFFLAGLFLWYLIFPDFRFGDFLSIDGSCLFNWRGGERYAILSLLLIFFVYTIVVYAYFKRYLPSGGVVQGIWLGVFCFSLLLAVSIFAFNDIDNTCIYPLWSELAVPLIYFIPPIIFGYYFSRKIPQQNHACQETTSGGKRAVKWGIILIALCAVGAVGVSDRWHHNRMDFIRCVFVNHGSDDTYDYDRLALLFRHTEWGECAPIDEDKHWAVMEKASNEWDWREAHLLLAIKYGYGGYFDINPRVIFGASYRAPVEMDPDDIAANEKNLYGIGGSVGDGKNLDFEKSFGLLKKAAEQGMPLAQRYLSYVYYTGQWGRDGNSIGGDIEQSMRWLRSHAEASQECVSNFYLGYRYRYGIEGKLSVDNDEAYRYFKLSSELTSTPGDTFFCIQSMVELARMYDEGIGVNPDKEMALSWIDRARSRASIENHGEKMIEYLEKNKEDIIASENL